MTFTAEHDVPIPYMQRTRDYYQALGFAPYRWAHYAEVPFTPLARSPACSWCPPQASRTCDAR